MSGQSTGNIVAAKPGVFSNSALVTSTIPKLNNPLLLNENLSRRIDSHSRPQHIRETFETQFNSIDKLLDTRISKLEELSVHPPISGPAQSLEWVKVRDEIQSYLNGTNSFIRETTIEIDNLVQDVKQQKDALSASDYLALKGQAHSLVLKKNKLHELFTEISNGSASGTIH